MEKEKECLHCGAGILGRSNRRYCSDQCRHQANNHNRRGNRAESRIGAINAALRKNRSILRQHSPHGKTTIQRRFLEQAGFDFRYLTQVYRTQRGTFYYLCYDYGFRHLPENHVQIINWQPYMDTEKGL